jgi:hypothetical protein
MANTTWSKTYTDFVTATANKVGASTFEDNISRASPFLSWMMDDGSITGRSNGKRWISGGTGNRIEEPVMSELNTTIKWYSGSEEFDTTQQNVGTVAIFDWKSLGGTCTITGDEKRRNAGKEKTIDLVRARMDQTAISLRTEYATAMFGDGTGNNGKEIYGIRAICPADRGTTVAYGDITANTSWWLCQRSRSGSTYGDVGDFDTNFRDYGKRLFHDCTEGSSAPDIHVVSQELEEAYHNTLQPFERHTSKKALDLGYDNILTFMGTPVLWDRFHPNARETDNVEWYMLNSEFLALRYHPDANFNVLGFQRPVNGDYISSPTILQSALCTNARRMHGVLTNIDIN